MVFYYKPLLTRHITVLVKPRLQRQWLYTIESLFSLSRPEILASHQPRSRKLSKRHFDWLRYGTVFSCWTKLTSSCHDEKWKTWNGMLLYLVSQKLGFNINSNTLLKAMKVFLRVLEYYNGILFLTTNRVGTIDEAFKSRIHVSLYYPPLDKQQTVDIFEVNLRRIHEIEAAKTGSRLDYTPLEIDDGSILKFAKRHFENHGPTQRWNGRQIRNAFQVAYSLAQFNMEKKNPDDSDDDFPQTAQDNGGKSPTSYRRSRLDSKQFKKVSQSVERFDEYLFRTRGADADTARNHRLRNDNYHDTREDDRRAAGIDYQNAQRRHPLPDLVRSPGGRGSMFDMPDSRENDWRSAGPDYQSPQRLHALPELGRSHSGRGSAFDAHVPSPRIPARDVSDDEDDSDSDGSSGGSEYEKYKRGPASKPARQPLVSSHSTPAVTKTKRSKEGRREGHYRQMPGGDALSPDDTGYGRGGSISSGRADSYGRGGY